MNLYHHPHWLPALLLGMSVFAPTNASNIDAEPEAADIAVAAQKTAPQAENAANLDDSGQTYSQLLSIYQDKISAQEALSDTYNPDIGESLIGMGRVQQKLGQHDQAIASFRRAMHIQRVNNGIYSLSQEPMLRDMINSYEATNDIASADDAYDQLQRLYLENRQINSPEVLALLKEKSDWHIKAYALKPGRKNLYHLGTAYRLMVDALNIASTDTDYGAITLLPLWRNLALANFLLADHGRRYDVGRREGFSFSTRNEVQVELNQDEVLVVQSYRNGLEALEKIVAFHNSNPESTPSQKAAAIADLADWHLVFDRYENASQLYREAWGLLADDQSAREELFGQPRIIPLETASAGATASYVEAQLSVTARGNPVDIQVLATAPENNEALGKAGYRTLRKSKFRPQLIDGEMVASNNINYRLELLP